MTRGSFTAVARGTFETSRSPRPALVAVVVAVAAAVSWMATVLVDLAIAAGALAVVLVTAGWLLLRRNPADAEVLTRQAAALYADATVKPAAVHYHLHFPPGVTAGDVIAALPPGQYGTPTEGGGDL